MYKFQLLWFCVLSFTTNFVFAHIREPATPEYVALVYFFSIILIGTVLREIFTKLDISIPYGALLTIVGLVWGTASYINSNDGAISGTFKMDPEQVLCFYFPVIIFNMAFCLDNVLFIKTIPVIMVIGIPVTVLTGCVFGSLMRIAYSSWSQLSGIIFGLLSTPIYPPSIVHLLKSQSERTKQISVILEGEAICSIIIAYISHLLCLGKVLGIITHWYQFIAVILRLVIGGLLVGYVFGIVGRYFIRKMYTNHMSVVTFSFTVPFFIYILSEMFLSGCGALSVAVMGLLMNVERAALTEDVDKFVTNLWQSTAYFFDIMLCTCISANLAFTYLPLFSWKAYVLAMITYLMYYIVRLCFYILFMYIINKFGYKMDAKNVLICVLSGVKCPFNLLVVITLIDTQGIDDKLVGQFLFYMGVLYMLSTIINGSLIKLIMQFFGITQISVARQINMNNCMKHIFAKREKIIAILKMDRFLIDTNWPMVTEATKIAHPNKSELETRNEDMFFLTLHSVHCPECNKELQAEPTAKQMKELIRDAKLRILKSKKISYSRQFENGMISKEAIRSLTQAVEMAMDSKERDIDLTELEKKCTAEDCFGNFLREYVHGFKKSKSTTHRIPRKFLRRWCYSCVVNQTWEMFMLWPVFCNVILGVIDIKYFQAESKKINPNFFHTKAHYSILVGEIFFFTLYFSEFVMKIAAYSWYYIWQHGFRTYFRSFWNVTDFIILVIQTVDLVFDILYTLNVELYDYVLYKPIMETMQWLRALRLFRVVELGFPHFVKYLDKKLDARLASGYELGKSYVIAEAEILELLPYMIDNLDIRENIKKKTEFDKNFITKLLSTIQKDKPWVAITVKTKQAIRTILKSMKETISQLKTTGWIDEYEQEILESSMFELYKKVNSIKTVPSSSPKIIFSEVSWMAGEEAVINYLFQHVIVKKFEPGDVVFGEGILADGIYVVVAGLFVLSYNPEKSILIRRQQYGQLPVVDYLTSSKCDEPFLDYILSGNCIGEHGILTKRPYNCTITADSHSQVYVLSSDVLYKAMEMSNDPVTGLECRIWKEVGVRIAAPLLASVPAYQNYTQDEIKYTLERAFVPNLKYFQTFAITEVIEDLILIEGLAEDYHSNELFVAPCYIPRTVQKLVFPQNSAANLTTPTITKLLIIPEKDLDEYDVMATAEETGEMIASGSKIQCLQHAAQKRIKMRRRQTIVKKSRSYLSRNQSIKKLWQTRSASLTKQQLSKEKVIQKKTTSTSLTNIKLNIKALADRVDNTLNH